MPWNLLNWKLKYIFFFFPLQNRHDFLNSIVNALRSCGNSLKSFVIIYEIRFFSIKKKNNLTEEKIWFLYTLRSIRSVYCATFSILLSLIELNMNGACSENTMPLHFLLQQKLRKNYFSMKKKTNKNCARIEWRGNNEKNIWQYAMSHEPMHNGISGGVMVSIYWDMSDASWLSLLLFFLNLFPFFFCSHRWIVPI